MQRPIGLSAVVFSALLSLGTVGPAPVSDDTKETTVKTDSVRRQSGGRRTLFGDPYFEISADKLLATLDDLTRINPHNGWRHSTTRGEAEAISYAKNRLSKLDFLRDLGLEVEQENFRTYLGIEFRQTRVHLTVGGTEFEVPADAPAGHRDSIDLAIRFDSDGELNDTRADPVVVEGSPLVIRSAAQVFALSPEDVEGRVVFLDYAVIDRVINDRADAIDIAWELAEVQPAGIVMVTAYSNQRGLSHGSFVSDLPAFTWVEVDPFPPVLFVRLEDLDAAGIDSWADVSDVESVRLTWDVDLFSPGNSSLLMARIPGADSSKAVILGAHIDSSNTPGAFDNGSGSTALIEVAQALDRSRTAPPVDLYLVWFGSHERGVYGSANFVSSHSELIDRSLAMLQMDCLGRPVDDIENFVTLETWTYGRFGDDRMTWPNYLEAAAATRGIATLPISYYGLVSDNTNFNAVDLPNANLIYMNPYDIWEIHYDNHLHDPYDTVELAGEVGDTFEEMARVMLTAALQTGEDKPRLRVTPEPDRRALFVGSHTEAAHMSTASFIEFGMALTWEGFDVDTIPYGRAVTAADLEETDLVIVLPVHDYPSTDGDVTLYDEAWSGGEIDALEGYVADGGMLVLTNSARRLKYLNYAYEDNEDWGDANAVGERFGVSFNAASMTGSTAIAVAGHQLVEGVTTLRLAINNGVPFNADEGVELARMAGRSVASLITAGSGDVLVLADLGLLGSASGEPQNLRFWQNIAGYARGR
jgi:hypothetical protein